MSRRILIVAALICVAVTLCMLGSQAEGRDRQGYQGHMSCSLDGTRDHALVLCTVAGFPARTNLACVGNITFHQIDLLIIQ